jgi:hypothetical protein
MCFSSNWVSTLSPTTASLGASTNARGFVSRSIPRPAFDRALGSLPLIRRYVNFQINTRDAPSWQAIGSCCDGKLERVAVRLHFAVLDFFGNHP